MVETEPDQIELKRQAIIGAAQRVLNKYQGKFVGKYLFEGNVLLSPQPIGCIDVFVKVRFRYEDKDGEGHMYCTQFIFNPIGHTSDSVEKELEAFIRRGVVGPSVVPLPPHA